MLIYFILYTSSAFTNYFSKFNLNFFFLKRHTVYFPLKGKCHFKTEFVSPQISVIVCAQCFKSFPKLQIHF